jgi:cytochrome c peroxidase
MRAFARSFTIVVLGAVAFFVGSILHRDPGSSGPVDREDRDVWSSERGERLASWIRTEYDAQSAFTRTPIPLAFSRAFSKRFTEAKGKVEINFETGRVAVSVENLEPGPGAIHEVWLVENSPGPNNTAAIDAGRDGDHIWKIGRLPASGELETFLDPQRLASFEVNIAAVMRVSADEAPEFLIGGMQSVVYLLGRELRQEAGNAVAAARRKGIFDVSDAFAAAQGGGKKPGSLVAQGRDLFLNGTFGGNGRTCASCHRLEFETTIDAGFIGTLPPTDPLFVGELNVNLPEFDPLDPRRPAFESPTLMRSKGLILENIQGTQIGEDGKLTHAPVFRMTPPVFNLGLTAPYGFSACCADLQTFSAGAVFQHFPKTLNRVAGVDFQVPTGAQLQALEAFQLSLSAPASGNFKVSGRGSLLSTKADPLASDITRAEVRGRNFFAATNSCVTCHRDTVFSGNNPVTGVTLNLDTGVEEFGQNRAFTPTLDEGNSGQFQVPPLFGLRKPHFFHNGVSGNETAALPGKTLLFTNLRKAVEFYTSQEFRQSPTGLEVNGTRFQPLFDMTPDQIDDVTAFLEAINRP